MRVFVSSTAVDLYPYRSAAQQTVLEHSWQPVMLMEHKAVPGGLTVPACQRLVQSCDLFILIAGHRCGWIPSQPQGGDGVSSITQLEFAAWGARAKVKPTLPPIIMLASDMAPATVTRGEQNELARASQIVFRARLKSTHIVHEFPFVSASVSIGTKEGSGASLTGTAVSPTYDRALHEFRTVLSNLLSKVMAAIAERQVARAQVRLQEAKSGGWVLGALGVGFGLLLAENQESEDDSNEDEY